MKIIKYLIIIFLALIVGLYFLTRVPFVQDRIVTSVIKNTFANPFSFPDDALTALVLSLIHI